MIAIKDMEMPKCCQKCRFEIVEGMWSCTYYYCNADMNREMIDDMKREEDRMAWCPLVEVKE